MKCDVCCETDIQEVYACFNGILDIHCSDGAIIVFHSARYGRNNSAVAAMCSTIYMSKCDVDVQYTMNRVCGGRQTCSLAVNTALFDDPCGYEEFLTIRYYCLPGIFTTWCQAHKNKISGDNVQLYADVIIKYQ